MAYKIVIGKTAQRNLIEIFDWYAGESSTVLKKFIGGFYARLDELAEHPELFGLVKQRPRFRKVKIRRFPYFIVFRMDDRLSKVFIAMVIHEKRNPESWLQRLR